MEELIEQIKTKMLEKNLRRCDIYKSGAVCERTTHNFFLCTKGGTIKTLINILDSLDLEIKIIEKGNNSK